MLKNEPTKPVETAAITPSKALNKSLEAAILDINRALSELNVEFPVGRSYTNEAFANAICKTFAEAGWKTRVLKDSSIHSRFNVVIEGPK